MLSQSATDPLTFDAVDLLIANNSQLAAALTLGLNQQSLNLATGGQPNLTTGSQPTPAKSDQPNPNHRHRRRKHESGLRHRA